MALFRPTYRDKKTGETKESSIWWFEFTFCGRRVRESSKSTRKTVAQAAEKNRRLELEKGFNAIEENRTVRIQTIGETADAYLETYKLRHPRSVAFASAALGHLGRLLGSTMRVDVSPKTVEGYQADRLREGAAPKTINEETGFLLRLLEDQGDMIRAKMRRNRTLKLKVRTRVSKAYSPREKAALIEAARNRRLPCVYTALMLGLHAGLRDGEILGLQWDRVDLERYIVTVGDSKTAAGENRTIPMNEELAAALEEHRAWFVEKFESTQPDWYVFPFGRPQPTDPTRPMTTLKTAWQKVKKEAGVVGRFHDSRHSFITSLAESGAASDETIRDLAGHVSKQMLKHYSHIGMEAKRRAVEALSKPQVSNRPLQEIPKVKTGKARSPA